MPPPGGTVLIGGWPGFRFGGRPPAAERKAVLEVGTWEGSAAGGGSGKSVCPRPGESGLPIAGMLGMAAGGFISITGGEKAGGANAGGANDGAGAGAGGAKDSGAAGAGFGWLHGIAGAAGGIAGAANAGGAKAGGACGGGAIGEVTVWPQVGHGPLTPAIDRGTVSVVPQALHWN